MFLVIFLAVILFGIGVYFLGKRFNQESQEDKNYLPDDGLIYDPVSGRMITLEEAENGIVVGDDALSRIKTDEEIETFYSGEKKEKEYIQRALILSGATVVDFNLTNVLRASTVIRGLASFQLQFMYQVMPGRFLGVAQVSYRLPGQYHAAGSEHQFIGFMVGVSSLGRSAVKDLETEILPAGLFMRLPRVIIREDLESLLLLFRTLPFTGA